MHSVNYDHPILVSGSLSCINVMNIEKAIQEINESELSFLHYDVVDGRFNNCFVFGDLILEKLRPHTDKPIEVHLAVENVEAYIEPFIKAGADYIAVHYETKCNHKEVFAKIRELGAKPILAFRCDSEVPDDFISLAKEVEWILKLTVNPGYAGQKIQPQAIQHIEVMRQQLQQHGLTTKIQADGNINSETIPRVVKAGADILTGGTSGLFQKGKTVQENLDNMRKAAIL
ncbi:MAG: ribulose-phosphate 3-epimerase [Longicatena sp.]